MFGNDSLHGDDNADGKNTDTSQTSTNNKLVLPLSRVVTLMEGDRGPSSCAPEALTRTWYVVFGLSPDKKQDLFPCPSIVTCRSAPPFTGRYITV